MAVQYTDQDLLWFACQEGQVEILIHHMKKKDLPLGMVDYYQIIKKFIEQYPHVVKQKSPHYHHQARLAKLLIAALGPSYQQKLQQEMPAQLATIEQDYQRMQRKRPAIISKKEAHKRSSFLKRLTNRLDKKVFDGDEKLFDDLEDDFDTNEEIDP